MRIKFWGVRGSLPTPYQPGAMINKIATALDRFFEMGFDRREQIHEYLRHETNEHLQGYGGNTMCVEVNGENTQLIIDGGSGIRQLGCEMMKGPCGKGKGEVHILMTHVHWDHIMGLPFFTPLFIPGNKIHIYGVEQTAEDMFRELFKKPYFPVSVEMLGSTIIYHRLKPRTVVTIGEFSVAPYRLDHPDPCWGYRIDDGKNAYAHCVDTEGTRISRKALGEDLPLYQGVDLMTFDAQYTILEKYERINWGHSSSVLGIDLAMRENIKTVAFVHHDPAASDEKIAELEQLTRRYYNDFINHSLAMGYASPEVKWDFGIEGTEYILKDKKVYCTKVGFAHNSNFIHQDNRICQH
jgi:phosphoribosyl 1,2-cyclic phosphodiesterase